MLLRQKGFLRKWNNGENSTVGLWLIIQNIQTQSKSKRTINSYAFNLIKNDMKKIFLFLVLVLVVGCSKKDIQEEFSTQEKIALIDSILSLNNSSVTMESIDLYNSHLIVFTADRIITSNDSLKFFLIRGKVNKGFEGCAIILPSEVYNLCLKIDSVIQIVSQPISYNKAFSVSNNGGLSITAKTNEAKDWEIHIDLKHKDDFSFVANTDFLKYLSGTLRACVDIKGDMKSSKTIVEEELYYHQNDKVFFEKVDKICSIKKTSSGLRYLVIKEGKGNKPYISNKVKIAYSVSVSDSILDKGVIESNLDYLIPGLQEGIQLQSVGSRYKFYIPSYLGYGFTKDSEIFNPFSPAIYEVELLSIK